MTHQSTVCIKFNGTSTFGFTPCVLWNFNLNFPINMISPLFINSPEPRLSDSLFGTITVPHVCIFLPPSLVRRRADISTVPCQVDSPSARSRLCDQVTSCKSSFPTLTTEGALSNFWPVLYFAIPWLTAEDRSSCWMIVTWLTDSGSMNRSLSSQDLTGEMIHPCFKQVEEQSATCYPREPVQITSTPENLKTGEQQHWSDIHFVAPSIDGS